MADLMSDMQRLGEKLAQRPPADIAIDGIVSRGRGRRRRRSMAAVAVIVPVVALGGIVVAQVLPVGPQPPVIAPLGAGSATVESLELADDAVWRSPEVVDLAGAVDLFAEQALGWSDVSVEMGADEGGPVWVTMTGPGLAGVRGLFVPSSQPGVWQLMQVGDGAGGQEFQPWSVGLKPPEGAMTADLYTRYQGQTWHLQLVDDQLQQGGVLLADHGLPQGGQLESLLIVYRDSTGATISAVGGQY